MSILSFTGLGQAKIAIYAVIAGLILATVVGAFFYVRGLKSDVTKLTERNSFLVSSNEILEQNNKVLKSNNETLSTANATNVATIKQLSEERKKATDAVAALAAANIKNKQTLAKLNAKIQELLKDPNADAPLAPVLREVIREIQKERAAL